MSDAKAKTAITHPTTMPATAPPERPLDLLTAEVPTFDPFDVLGLVLDAANVLVLVLVPIVVEFEDETVPVELTVIGSCPPVGD